MTNNKHLIWISLFWGSLWGLAEATLGHILHQLQIPGIAGYVMFPVGIFFMLMAFRYSDQSSAIFLTALVAANIKLIDLWLPSSSLFTVINPAVAILCESLAVACFFQLKDFKKILSRLDYLLGMSIMWRVFYGMAVLTLGSAFPVSNFIGLGGTYIMSFFLLESAANAALIYGLYHINKCLIHSLFTFFSASEKNEFHSLHPLLRHPVLHTIPLLVVAIAVEFFLF